MYQRIATTHLATGGGINTINVLGEYNTALCRDGKVYPLGKASTEAEAREMHKTWAEHYQAQETTI